MLETIRQDYIRTARAKGLSERAVVMKHAFRNSLIPIVTLLGFLLPAFRSDARNHPPGLYPHRARQRVERKSSGDEARLPQLPDPHRHAARVPAARVPIGCSKPSARTISAPRAPKG